MTEPNLPAVQPAGPLASGQASVDDLLAPFTLRAPPRYATNINVASAWGAALFTQLRTGATKELDELDGSTIEVVYWIAHIVPVTKDDGEVVTKPRVIVSDSQGRATSFTGEASVRYWIDILALKGQGPYDPPLRVCVARHKSAKFPGGRFHTLSLELPKVTVEQEEKHKPPKK